MPSNSDNKELLIILFSESFAKILAPSMSKNAKEFKIGSNFSIFFSVLSNNSVGETSLFFISFESSETLIKSRGFIEKFSY